MTKKKPIKDEAGQAWQARADAAWQAALQEADGDARVAHGIYSRKPRDGQEDTSTLAPVLPDFEQDKHPSVTREVLGRFVEDRDTGTVHDVNNAGNCQIDRITNATFYHFGHEVPDDLTRHKCIEV